MIRKKIAFSKTECPKTTRILHITKEAYLTYNLVCEVCLFIVLAQQEWLMIQLVLFY